MARFTFDTSFIISKKLSVYPDNFLYSDVVLLELIGSSKDESTFKKHQAARQLSAELKRLIIPNTDDWLMAGKILYWVEQGKRKGNRGKALAKRPGETQRMALDVLIATSARRYEVIVVTENVDDFKTIQYYCEGFRFMSGAEYLARQN